MVTKDYLSAEMLETAVSNLDCLLMLKEVTILNLLALQP